MIRRRFVVLPVAASLAAAAFAAVPAARAQNLVANPVLLRELPPPGWIADRRPEWLAQHPVYQSTCQSGDVAREIKFLNRIVARDEYLLAAAGKADMDDPAMARQAQLARRDMGTLRNDIAAVDELTAQLQVLPACPKDTAAPLPATPAAAPTPSPPPEPSPPAPKPAPAATAPPPPAPATTPEGTTNAAGVPPPDAAQTVTLRYDDRLVALTPLSIRAFNKAVDAIHNGQEVHLAIDGCAADADFSKGSQCAKRLGSLKRLLAEHDVRDTKRVFPDLP